MYQEEKLGVLLVDPDQYVASCLFHPVFYNMLVHPGSFLTRIIRSLRIRRELSFSIRPPALLLKTTNGRNNSPLAETDTATVNLIVDYVPVRPLTVRLPFVSNVRLDNISEKQVFGMC